MAQPVFRRGLLAVYLVALSLSCASAATYSFEIRKHKGIEDEEGGLSPADIRKLLQGAQSLLCEACSGDGRPCHIRLSFRGKLKTFSDKLLPKPIARIEDAREFLKTERDDLLHWKIAGKTPESRPHTIYMINGFEPTAETGGFPTYGRSNVSWNWIILALKAGKHDEEWFAEESSYLSHELGHNVGLPHSDLKKDIMYCQVFRDSVTLSPNECAAFINKRGPTKPDPKQDPPCPILAPLVRGAIEQFTRNLFCGY